MELKVRNNVYKKAIARIVKFIVKIVIIGLIVLDTTLNFYGFQLMHMFQMIRKLYLKG